MKASTAEFVCSAHHRRQFSRDGLPEVAFVGRSNVGKSSLLNRLLHRKNLARTGSTPGRTRAVNYFLVDGKLYFVDLPGYGFAKAPRTERQRWADLMDDYFGRPDAPPTLLVQLVDGKVGATRLDVEALDWFHSLGQQPLVVATKIDKLPRTRRPRALAAVGQRLGYASETIVPFSAVTGEGIQQLWRGIYDFLEARRPAAASETLNEVGMK